MSMSPCAAPSRMTTATSHKYTEWKKYMPTNFSIGIRALLVDDDRVCLAIMKQMLTKAQYEGAVPKQILELMNIPGITRSNVVSHFQKYRLRLRKFGHLCSGVAARTGQQESLNSPGLCAPGQMPAQTLASSEQEMLCRPSGSLSVPQMGHLNLQHASMQSQPLMDCQTNMCNISPHWKVAGSYNSSHRANNMQISHLSISSNRNSCYNNANTISGHQQLGIGRRTDESFSNVGVFNGSRISGSTSSSVLPCEVGSMPHPWILSGAFPGQEPEESFGLLYTDPNKYLVDDIESLTNNFG